MLTGASHHSSGFQIDTQNYPFFLQLSKMTAILDGGVTHYFQSGPTIYHHCQNNPNLHNRYISAAQKSTLKNLEDRPFNTGWYQVLLPT